jgi:hypothetical protein
MPDDPNELRAEIARLKDLLRQCLEAGDPDYWLGTDAAP